MTYCGIAYLLDSNQFHHRIGKLTKIFSETLNIPNVQDGDAKLKPKQFCTFMNSRTFAECGLVKFEYDNVFDQIMISIKRDVVVAFSESLGDYMGFISPHFCYGDYNADFEYLESTTSMTTSFKNRATIYSLTKSDEDMTPQHVANHSNPTIILELVCGNMCDLCEEEDENCICHMMDYEEELV